MRTGFTHLLAIAALGSGCLAEDTDEAGEIAAAIEEENGGLDMEDEAPLFGLNDEFDAADLGDTLDVTDPMADDELTVALMESPDAVVARVQLLWGQLPPDGTPEARDWSGRISVNRGALIVRRTIAFEAITNDRILPRTDRRTVEFESRTAPHVDGLILLVADPEPESADPQTLTYADATGEVYVATMAELVAGPVALDLGDGNHIAGVAMARPVDTCDHGFMRGRWRQVAPNRGVLLGGVADAEGNPIGHVRGIYGQRLDGEQVFFGKYINLDGQFRGIFAGRYENGEYRGRWLTRSGDHGVLGGEYRETLPGPRNGGHFAGRWGEVSCLPLDVPPAP